MKILLILAIAVTVSCGRKDRSCRTKKTMVYQCQAQNTPNYGYQYAVDMCNRTYTANTCY